MKPLIGITVDCNPEPENARTMGNLSLYWNYPECISKAGGIPVLLPPQMHPDDAAWLVDGVLIPGGADLDSSLWGEDLHPEAKLVAPERTTFELRLLNHVPDRMPVLGICYGCQIMAVHAGGSILQHLPDVLGHDEHSKGTLETYELDCGSIIGAAVLDHTVRGKSYHHQAIAEPGGSFRVTAWAPDGTIEAIEDVGYRWRVGVQWHPERTPDLPETQSLFAAFVEAAAEYKRSKQ